MQNHKILSIFSFSFLFVLLFPFLTFPLTSLRRGTPVGGAPAAWLPERRGCPCGGWSCQAPAMWSRKTGGRGRAATRRAPTAAVRRQPAAAARARPCACGCGAGAAKRRRRRGRGRACGGGAMASCRGGAGAAVCRWLGDGAARRRRGRAMVRPGDGAARRLRRRCGGRRRGCGRDRAAARSPTVTDEGPTTGRCSVMSRSAPLLSFHFSRFIFFSL